MFSRGPVRSAARVELLVGHSEFGGLPRGHIKCGAGLGPSGVKGSGGEDPYSVQTGGGHDMNPPTIRGYEGNASLGGIRSFTDIRYSLYRVDISQDWMSPENAPSASDLLNYRAEKRHHLPMALP